MRNEELVDGFDVVGSRDEPEGREKADQWIKKGR